MITGIYKNVYGKMKSIVFLSVFLIVILKWQLLFYSEKAIYTCMHHLLKKTVM